MADGEEQLPLHDGQISGSEFLLDERRRSLKVWQILAVSAGLAFACTALVVPRQPSHSAAQIPSRDMSGKGVFLSEVVVDSKGGGAADAAAEPSKDAPSKRESSAHALQAAEQLNDKAVHFKGRADDLKKKAKDTEGSEESLRKQVSETRDRAEKDRNDAKEARNKAVESKGKADALLLEAAKNAKDAQLEAEEKASEILEEARKKVDSMTADANKEASDLGIQAEDLDKNAADLEADATKRDSSADSDDSRADALKAKAQAMQSQAAEAKKKAIDTGKQARQDVAAQRMCIGLPGVKLLGNSPATFDPVVGEHKITDDWQCNDWCLKHADCKQTVFTWETKTCEFFKEATAQPLLFRESWPWFNSSYCDAADQKQNMLDMLHQVYDVKPWVPPLHNCSFGADSCLHTKCCADVCDASWDFKTCKYYTCYKRDDNWAGCKTGGPPANWDGTELGGHPNTEVAPAPEGKLIQGTRLYCFSVVMWDLQPKEAWQSSEGELANNWKERGLGIMQCDDYSIFDGLGGGSVHNIQSFIRAWNMVKDDGRWKNNDWTIKVDPDAVFFPDHFRRKIEWQYRTPQGATVYMRNTFYKFQFLGALEALTREAMEVYFDRSWECESKLGQQGGEDYWLLQCLEGLGIDYQTDNALLHDKYAADENCDDPNSVAHHFFKKVEGNDGWDECWNTANDAWNTAHPE